MSPESIAAQAVAAPSSSTSNVGYGYSLTDISNFEGAMARAAQSGQSAQFSESASSSAAVKSLMQPFQHINAEAAEIATKASEVSGKASMTPGEMIMLTVRCQEFMFHCQLTSNIANRTSDGLQQLFRQQS